MIKEESFYYYLVVFIKFGVYILFYIIDLCFEFLLWQQGNFFIKENDLCMCLEFEDIFCF